MPAPPSVPSKLAPVAPPARPVDRPRLAEVLDGPAQVVVITAPAGYGKSTLLATWAAGRPDLTVAWVSLDEFDADEVVFWDLLISSLACHVPAGAEAAAVLREQGRGRGSFLPVLQRALAETGAPVVLVLEDFHRIVSARVGADLAALVERCAPNLRLVVASRHDVPLPVARWVAEGRAAELRESDLAFRADEAVHLVAPYHRASGPDLLPRLVGLTEGWAVGLLLGALALEGAGDAGALLDGAFAHDRHLVGYLTDEILDRLPVDVADIVLDLSLVPWFDIELATVVVGDAGVGATVARVIEANPFIVELGPGMYRLHHVVAAVAAAERRWRTPDRHLAVLRRAADEFQRRGATGVAVDLLLRAGEVDEAVDLVVGSALMFNDEGRLREFGTWFRALPSVAPGDIRRASAYSLAAVFAGDLDLAVKWAFRTRDLPRSPADDGLVATTMAVALAVSGRPADAAEWLDEMARAGHDGDQPMFIDARMSNHAARLALQLGMVERALPWIERIEARRGDPLAEVHAPAMRASWLLLQGNAVAASPLARSAVEAAARRHMRPHPATADADIADAEASLAMLRLDRTAAALERLATDADVIAWPWFHLRRWPLAVWFRALDDGWSAAHDLVEALGGGDVPLVGDLLPLWHRLMCRTALALRRAAEAAGHLPFVPAGPARALLEARLAGQRGRAADLDQLLAPAYAGHLPDQIEAHLVVAAHTQGERARRAFERAVELARPGQWWLPFALDGAALGALTVQSGLGDELPVLLATLSQGSEDLAARPAALVEALSQRELDVLALLPSHLSYTEIGTRLYVSTNTIKTHVASIYRKLDASSRSEAVRVARGAGLLER